MADLGSLKKRIDRAKRASRPRRSPKKASSATLPQFLNVGVEFMGGILAGVLGGLFVDWLMGTSPWGLITFFILGSAAGFLNVYRSLTKATRKR